MRKYFNILILMCMCFMLSGFSLRMPFSASKALDNIDSQALVTVAITHVTTGDDSKRNRVFWDHTYAVIDKISTHKGYLGHKVRQQILGNEGWTMTVWDSEDSLNAFVIGDSHKDAMKNGLDAVDKARFVNFTIERSKIPLSWSDAEKIMNEKGRNYY